MNQVELINNNELKISKMSNRQIQNPKKNISVNINCFCKKIFTYKDNLLYVLPCCHIVHEECFNKHILDKQYNNLYKSSNQMELECPVCQNKITQILNEDKIKSKSKSKYKEYYHDIECLKIDESAQINYMMLPIGIVNFTTCLNKTILIESMDQIINTLEYVFKSFNIKINIIDNTIKNPILIKDNQVSWVNKKDNNSKMVVISNHSNYLDSFILYYLFRCGFVSSDFINSSELGKLIATKCKLLIFKRGVDTNMVEKIKEYLEEMKRITIYPEGAMGNNNTLMNFRSGAFYTGANICPVVIKYKNFIHDSDMRQYLFKLITQNEIVVDVYINDLWYPPFNEEKIEAVRDHMANVGGLVKTRVSNKKLQD